MTTINAGLSGSGVRTAGRATGAQDWRQPPASPRSSVDWNDPKFATPQPAPTWKHARRPAQALDETPQLPERTIRVKARPPGTFYTTGGMPIPQDQWTELPISPGLLKAIAQGDLEEDTEGEGRKGREGGAGQPERQEPQHRRRSSQAAEPTQAE